jgi:hypothetical protein
VCVGLPQQSHRTVQRPSHRSRSAAGCDPAPAGVSQTQCNATPFYVSLPPHARRLRTPPLTWAATPAADTAAAAGGGALPDTAPATPTPKTSTQPLKRKKGMFNFFSVDTTYKRGYQPGS